MSCPLNKDQAPASYADATVISRTKLTRMGQHVAVELVEAAQNLLSRRGQIVQPTSLDHLMTDNDNRKVQNKRTSVEITAYTIMHRSLRRTSICHREHNAQGTQVSNTYIAEVLLHFLVHLVEHLLVLLDLTGLFVFGVEVLPVSHEELQALERFHFLGNRSSGKGGLGRCGDRRGVSVIGSLKE